MFRSASWTRADRLVPVTVAFFLVMVVDDVVGWARRALYFLADRRLSTVGFWLGELLVGAGRRRFIGLVLAL
jgi:hypothetical protein